MKNWSFYNEWLLSGKDNGVTSSSDGRALQETTLDVPHPPIAPPRMKGHHDSAVWLQPLERESSHDSMVSSTSNLPSSSAAQESDAASVLLYQSCNSGKDPRLWNVQEVMSFLFSIGCSNYVDAFEKQVCQFVSPFSKRCLKMEWNAEKI